MAVYYQDYVSLDYFRSSYIDASSYYAPVPPIPPSFIQAYFQDYLSPDYFNQDYSDIKLNVFGGIITKSITVSLINNVDFSTQIVKKTPSNIVFDAVATLSPSANRTSLRSISFIEQTDFNNNIIRSISRGVSLAEQTDLSFSPVKSTSLTIGLNQNTDLLQQIIRDRIITSALVEQTDINTALVASINRNVVFVEQTDLSGTAIARVSTLLSLSEATDLFNNIVYISPSKSISELLSVNTDLTVAAGALYSGRSPLVAQTDINLNAVRSTKESTSCVVNTDINNSVIAGISRSAPLDVVVSLNDQVIRLTPETISFAEQTDFSSTYVFTSPSQSAVASLDVASYLSLSPGIRSSIKLSLEENTTLTETLIRSYTTGSQFATEVDLNDFIIRGYSTTIAVGETTDLATVTGRFRGGNASFTVDTDLSIAAFGSTGLKAIGEDFVVNADLNPTIVRTSPAGTSIVTDVNLSLYMVRSTALNAKTDVSTEMSTNTGRYFVAQPSLASQVDFRANVAQIYSINTDISVSDVLTVYVNVAGTVIPIETINFTLQAINQFNIELTSVNQLNFIL